MSSKISTHDLLTILKLPEGGYMVQEGYRGDIGNYTYPMFAATTIEEALKFIKSKLTKKETNG